MPQFKNLSTLEDYVKKKVLESIQTNLGLEDIFAETMQEVIQKNVYDVYTPVEYERRGEQGGFLDTRFMHFTNHIAEGSRIVSTFENLAQGQDTMVGKYIAEMIEKGLKEPYNNPDGPWAEPRPFLEDTAQVLETTKRDEVIGAFKIGLITSGLKVK